MKYIYIHGSFKSNNFGDYLLAQIAFNCVNEYLHEKNLSNKVEILMDEINPSYKKYINVNCLSLEEAIKKCDLMFCAGGGYFGEPKKDIKWSIRCLKYHVNPIIKLIKEGKSFCIIGVGAGNISYHFLKRKIKNIFNNSKYITVRDIESFKFLKKIGVLNTISVYPDWVMSDESSKILNKFKDEVDNNLILIHLPIIKNIEKMNIVCKDLKKFLSDNNEIKYIICSDNISDDQYKSIDYIYDFLNSDRVEKFYYNDPYELIKILNKSKYIVTSKLHVGICGIKMKKKVIALFNHPKIHRFYNQIQQKDYIVDLNKLKNNQLYYFLSQIVNEDIEKDYETIVNKSNVNKVILYNFLNDNLEEDLVNE